MSGVSKRFGDLVVLDGLDLELHPGETLVMLGRSGTGKSVTLKHVVGLLRPDAGRILVGDVDVATATPAQLRAVRRRVGFMFQTGALIAWLDVRANVALPLVEERRLPRARVDEAVEQALASVELLDAADRMPAQISGGMRRRAALARVLVQEPDIVLYDEPTSGLDPVLSRSVARLIRRVQGSRRAALVVTHDLALAFSIADRIGLHDEGRFVEVGPPEVFRASEHPVVRSFLADAPASPPETGR